MIAVQNIKVISWTLSKSVGLSFEHLERWMVSLGTALQNFGWFEGSWHLSFSPNSVSILPRDNFTFALKFNYLSWIKSLCLWNDTPRERRWRCRDKFSVLKHGNWLHWHWSNRSRYINWRYHTLVVHVMAWRGESTYWGCGRWTAGHLYHVCCI